MIVIESPSKRYRAVLKETKKGVEVCVFDRGRGATRGLGDEISVTHFDNADGNTLADVRIAVHNHLLTLQDAVKNHAPHHGPCDASCAGHFDN